MVASSKDVAIVGGILALGALIIYGGKELFKAIPDLSNIKFPEFPDVKLPDIKFPDFNISNTNPVDTTYPSLPQNDEAIIKAIQEQGGLANLKQDEIVNLLKGLTPLGTSQNPASSPTSPTSIDIVLNDPTLTDEQKKALVRILNTDIGVNDPNNDPNKFQPPKDENIFVPAPSSGQVPKDSEIISKESLGITDKVTTEIMKPIPKVINELPVEQNFQGGGLSFIGGTIRENPIDTFSEVLKYFPELTASQARDFLDATKGKILPSQVELVDPDIKNIVAGVIGGGQGQAIPVSQDPLQIMSIRESENLRAYQYTCENFGLNCELSRAEMA